MWQRTGEREHIKHMKRGGSSRCDLGVHEARWLLLVHEQEQIKPTDLGDGKGGDMPRAAMPRNWRGDLRDAKGGDAEELARDLKDVKGGDAELHE